MSQFYKNDEEQFNFQHCVMEYVKPTYNFAID